MAASKKATAAKTAAKRPTAKALPAKKVAAKKVAAKSTSARALNIPANTEVLMNIGGKMFKVVLRNSVSGHFVGKALRSLAAKTAPAKLPADYEVDPPRKTKKIAPD